jgi:heat shock protein HtpX
MGPVGLQTYIWANNTRSLLLLALFPVLLVGIIFGFELVLMGLGYLPGSGGGLDQDLGLAARLLAGAAPLGVVAALAWFAIAFFNSQAMIDAMTGARKVGRQDEPELYNLLENLAISRGLTTPALRIVEVPEMNAYASGLRDGHYCVTVTRGLVEALDRDEIEAVLGHELTHILNKDARTMVIASIFAGIITVLAQIAFRAVYYSGGGGRRSDSDSKSRNGGALILIGLAIAAVGYGLAIVIRLMLSRRREFVADAGSVELTKNPDAMISALRKIQGRSYVNAPEEVQGMFLDNIPDRKGIDWLFATHPPMSARIARLVKFAGGRDPGPWSPPEPAQTAVPATGDAPPPAETAVPTTG